MTKLQPGRLPILGTTTLPGGNADASVVPPREVDGLPLFLAGDLITADMLNGIVEHIRKLEARVSRLEAR